MEVLPSNRHSLVHSSELRGMTLMASVQPGIAWARNVQTVRIRRRCLIETENARCRRMRGLKSFRSLLPSSQECLSLLPPFISVDKPKNLADLFRGHVPKLFSIDLNFAASRDKKAKDAGENRRNCMRKGNNPLRQGRTVKARYFFWPWQIKFRGETFCWSDFAPKWPKSMWGFRRDSNNNGIHDDVWLGRWLCRRMRGHKFEDPWGLRMARTKLPVFGGLLILAVKGKRVHSV